MTRLVRTGAVVLAAALAVAAPPVAVAGPIIDRAVEGLRSNPVYVDPAAERAISASDADRLRGRITGSGAGPTYIAVLPGEARNEAGGSADAVMEEIYRELRREGTYAVVVGNQFRAGNVGTLPRGVAPRLADDAFEARASAGVAAVLLDFVDRVGDARAGEETAARGTEEDEGGGIPVGWVVLGVGAGGLGLLFLRRRRRRREDDAALAEVKQEAQADLLALAEDIRALDLDVEMPNADPRAKADYGQAVAAYERADRALDRARSPEELEEVGTALEEGRYAMAAAKARLEGREPPERRPPCFFDPRHGPSVADVEWAPPGGSPRPVPVCAADAQLIGDGRDPSAREVLVHGERVPYWQAGPAFSPYMGGFFSPFGGLLPGVLIGSMFGSGFGFGGPMVIGGDGPGDGGFGDFGGGDFGDFGGGDLGGGDFGGGDIGGGDF